MKRYLVRINDHNEYYIVNKTALKKYMLSENTVPTPDTPVVSFIHHNFGSKIAITLITKNDEDQLRHKIKSIDKHKDQLDQFITDVAVNK